MGLIFYKKEKITYSYNGKKMKRSILYLNNIQLNINQIHKLRGYIGRIFKDHDIVHNHDLKTGKLIYRYPLIQFKLIENVPAIIALTDQGIDIFNEIFMKLDKVLIEDISLKIFEKNLSIDNVQYGFSNESIIYNFDSPWIGLNQKNYKQYIKEKNLAKKENILKKAIVGNILSMSKSLGYWLEKDQLINAELQVNTKKVILKSKVLMGFVGFFKTNFIIPDFIGIGKSVSRGYGTVRRVA